MMRSEGVTINNDNGNKRVQNGPSFSQSESEGQQRQQKETTTVIDKQSSAIKTSDPNPDGRQEPSTTVNHNQQQQQQPLIQPIRGMNKQLQRQQQLLAQKQLQQQQHEHQQQLLSNYRQEQEQQPPPLQPPQSQQQQKLLQQSPHPPPQQQQQHNILQQQIQKYRQQLQLQPSQQQQQPYQLQPSQLQQITKEDLGRVLSCFDSVLTRHGNNPIDSVWKKAKDFMTIAFMDYLSESPVGRLVAPPLLSPSFSQSLPSIRPYPASLSSSSLSSPHHQSISDVPWKPPSESIVKICQGRNFVLYLSGIPRAGNLILSIINVNGIMRGEDVTYNFTRSRTVSNPIEKGTVRWNIRPENATSKIPYSARGLNNLDRNAFHMIRIRFVEDGRTVEQGQDLEFEDKYIVVEGRGTSKSKDISKRMEMEWGRLMNRTRVEERRKTSKRKREDDNKDGSKEKDEGSEKERCKRTRKDEGKIETNDIRKDMGRYMMADCKTLNAEPCHPSSPSALPPSSSTNDSERELDTDKEPLETFTLSRDSPRPPIIPPSSHPLPLPTSSSQPPSLPPSSQPPPLPPFSKEPLHLSIRLMDTKSERPIEWGTMVDDDDEMCIAIHNPETVNTVRVVCQVTDSKENPLPIQGDRLKDIRPKESMVMCKFTASKEHRPMQLHFLAANLPLVPGTPLFHTRLFVNVK